jgi:hypothetical protein
MIIGEKSFNPITARGLLDRTVTYSCLPGTITNDFTIKQVVNAPYMNPEKEKQYLELMNVRKLMLLYRLIHYNDLHPVVKTI